MKIVFTAKGGDWESHMDPRFGRMEMLAIYDDVANTLTSVQNNETEGMEHGAGLQTSKKVLELNPDIIITGNGAGEKALAILKRSSVKMYIGADDMNLRDAYEAYKNNQLQLQY